MRIALKDLTHEFLLPLWQNKSLAVIDQFVAPSADIHTSFLKGEGPNALKLHAQKTFMAFSSFTFSIEDIVQQQNTIIYKWIGNAIHVGKILNFNPTDKKITFSGIGFGKIVEGSISNYHCFTDLPRVLMQNAHEGDRADDDAENATTNKENLILLIKDTTGKKLTNREIECLGLWLKGCSIKESAKLLGGLSSRTIQTFRENIKRKLNVDSYQQLLKVIQQAGAFPKLLAGFS